MDCQKYNIDIVEVYKRLQPYFYLINPDDNINRIKFINWLEVIAGSLQYSQDWLYNTCSETRTFLNYTGQHLSLESLLNDNYDNDLRRIFITENNLVGVPDENWYLYSEIDPEGKVWYLYSEIDPVDKIWFSDGDNVSETNFTVNIPSTIAYSEDQVRGLLNKYVISGKIYNIITY